MTVTPSHPIPPPGNPLRQFPDSVRSALIQAKRARLLRPPLIPEHHQSERSTTAAAQFTIADWSTASFCHPLSHTLNLHGRSWSVKVFPGGACEENVDDVAVFVVLDQDDDADSPPVSVRFELRLLKADGVVVHSIRSDRITFAPEKNEDLEHATNRGFMDYCSQETARRCIGPEDGVLWELKIVAFGDELAEKIAREKVAAEEALVREEEDFAFHVLGSVDPNALAMDFGKFLETASTTGDVQVSGCAHAHSQILQARSPGAYEQLRPVDPSAAAGPFKYELDLPFDVRTEAVEMFLSFVYSGARPGEDELKDDLAAQVLGIAEKFNLPALKMACAQVLAARLRVENVVQCIVTAQECNATVLFSRALRFFNDEAEAVVSHPTFDPLTIRHPALGFALLQVAYSRGEDFVDDDVDQGGDRNKEGAGELEEQVENRRRWLSVAAQAHHPLAEYVLAGAYARKL